jgi:hypothetical protein
MPASTFAPIDFEDFPARPLDDNHRRRIALIGMS